MQSENRRFPGTSRRYFIVRHPGMTLIELLIVIVIIGILISAVMVASTSLIGKSKTRNTQAVLQIVADAAEQFKRSEMEKPTITRNARYKARYGLYPPDELEVFGTVQPPVAAVPFGLASPIGSTIVPAEFPNMRFYKDGTAADATEHRDLAALIVAIESQGGEAAAMLDRISDRNRDAGALDADGIPVQYLSRPAGINPESINQEFGAEDLQIRYILDDWGIPISYMAQRDFNHDDEEATRSSNHDAWNEASTEIIRINNGQPLIFSYGPNGKEQTSAEFVNSHEGFTFMGDFEPQSETPDNRGGAIDHPANADNVYLNDQLREKLAKGIEDHG